MLQYLDAGWLIYEKTNLIINCKKDSRKNSVLAIHKPQSEYIAVLKKNYRIRLATQCRS